MGKRLYVVRGDRSFHLALGCEERALWCSPPLPAVLAEWLVGKLNSHDQHINVNGIRSEAAIDGESTDLEGDPALDHNSELTSALEAFIRRSLKEIDERLGLDWLNKYEHSLFIAKKKTEDRTLQSSQTSFEEDIVFQSETIACMIRQAVKGRILTAEQLFRYLTQQTPHQKMSQPIKPDVFWQGFQLAYEGASTFKELHKASRAYLQKESIIRIRAGIGLEQREKREVFVCRRCSTVFDKPYRHECAMCEDADLYCPRCVSLGLIRGCTLMVDEVKLGENILDELNLDEDKRLQIRTRPSSIHTGDNHPQVLSTALSWMDRLTPWQQKAARSVLECIDDANAGSVHLLWAVTGAGKTEMLYPALERLLAQQKKVLWATPRRDVVLELWPRLKEAFPAVDIARLYGGADVFAEAGQLTLATTHQALLFQNYFDTIIVDEADAYPYTVEDYLQQGLMRALHAGGKMIIVTATPGIDEIRQVAAKGGRVVLVPKRYHGRPLPEPVFMESSRRGATRDAAGEISFLGEDEDVLVTDAIDDPYGSLSTNGSRRSSRSLMTGSPSLPKASTNESHRTSRPLSGIPLKRKKADNNFLLYCEEKLKQGRRLFIFVPRVADVEPVVRYLKRALPGAGYVVAGTHAKDPDRDLKVTAFRQGDVKIMVTTTILERGVTIAGSDVFVLGADAPIFDAPTLVQIAGRAGRKADDPDGTVIFWGNTLQPAIRSAIQHIRWMNDWAEKAPEGEVRSAEDMLKTYPLLKRFSPAVTRQGRGIAQEEVRSERALTKTTPFKKLKNVARVWLPIIGRHVSRYVMRENKACLLCEKSFSVDTDHPLGALLCLDCRHKVVPPEAPLCGHCGREMNDPRLMFQGATQDAPQALNTKRSYAHDDDVCIDCKRTWLDRALESDERYAVDSGFTSSSVLQWNRSAAQFTTDMKAALHRYKYERELALFPLFATLLRLAYLRYAKDLRLDGITFVPSNEEKDATRGFNQAAALARDLGRYTGLPVFRLLQRETGGAVQATLGRTARLKQAQSLFSYVPSSTTIEHDERFKKTSLLLIDDVYTTGGTLHACARALKDGGHETIYGLTVFRA